MTQHCEGCISSAGLIPGDITLEREACPGLPDHEAEFTRLRAALDIFTPHGNRDVRVAWANGEVCETCSHSLCTEVKRLRTRLAELEEEDRQWDKHSLVEIVEERNRLRARDKVAEEMKNEVLGFLSENKEYADTLGHRELLAHAKRFESAGKEMA